MKSSPGEDSRKNRWGLFAKRERWALTWPGRILLLLATGVLIIGFGLSSHSFLAVHSPVPAGVLVVEGWLPASASGECATLFAKGKYSMILTTGGPTGTNHDSMELSDTYASVGAQRLIMAGVPGNLIVRVPCWLKKRDRTYASAVAVQEWLSTHHRVKAINVATLGVHSRRTRLMYEAAFEKKVAIGIIAIPNREYEPERWWDYSEGVKEVISEGAAYLYARLIFRPD